MPLGSSHCLYLINYIMQASNHPIFNGVEEHDKWKQGVSSIVLHDNTWCLTLVYFTRMVMFKGSFSSLKHWRIEVYWSLANNIQKLYTCNCVFNCNWVGDNICNYESYNLGSMMACMDFTHLWIMPIAFAKVGFSIIFHHHML